MLMDSSLLFSCVRPDNEPQSHRHWSWRQGLESIENVGLQLAEVIAGLLNKRAEFTV